MSCIFERIVILLAFDPCISNLSITIHIRLCEKYFKGVILHIMAMHNLPWGLGLRFIARKNFYLNKFRTHRFRS